MKSVEKNTRKTKKKKARKPVRNAGENELFDRSVSFANRVKVREYGTSGRAVRKRGKSAETCKPGVNGSASA